MAGPSGRAPAGASGSGARARAGTPALVLIWLAVLAHLLGPALCAPGWAAGLASVTLCSADGPRTVPVPPGLPGSSHEDDDHRCGAHPCGALELAGPTERAALLPEPSSPGKARLLLAVPDARASSLAERLPPPRGPPQPLA